MDFTWLVIFWIWCGTYDRRLIHVRTWLMMTFELPFRMQLDLDLHYSYQKWVLSHVPCCNQNSCQISFRHLFLKNIFFLICIYIGAFWSSCSKANSSLIGSKPAVCQVHIWWINKGMLLFVVQEHYHLHTCITSKNIKSLFSRLAIAVW